MTSSYLLWLALVPIGGFAWLRARAGERPVAARRPAPGLTPYAPVANPGLVETMKRHLSAGAGRATYVRFIEEVAASTLIAEIPSVPPGQIASQRSGEGPGRVELVTQRTAEGRKVLSAYTDDESFGRLRPEAKGSIVLRARDLFDLAVQAGIDHVILDRGGAPSVSVDKKYFASLAAGKVPEVE